MPLRFRVMPTLSLNDSRTRSLSTRKPIQVVKEEDMAEPVPAGSDVSAGTYRCTECGYRLEVGSIEHLPPCPKCSNGSWNTESGGDSVDDPYPKR